MSKNLNKISAHNKYFTLTGIKSSPMHMPATSSITTLLGSLPQIFSTIVDDHVPANIITAVNATEIPTGGTPPRQARYQQMQVAKAANVPPPFKYPIPRVLLNNLWKSIW